jgi:hypothetical protein
VFFFCSNLPLCFSATRVKFKQVLTFRFISFQLYQRLKKTCMLKINQLMF